MKKYTKKLQYAVLLCMAALGIGLLAGCDGVTSPAVQDGAGKVAITIAAGDESLGMRTLNPTIPSLTNFSKFVIGFQKSTGETRPSVTLIAEGETPKLEIDLDQGNWTITVQGYVTRNAQDVLTAEGSRTVDIGDATMSISIYVKPLKSTGNGTFTWSVQNIPDSTNNGTLELAPVEGSGTPLSVPLTGDGATPSGSRSIASGCYRLTMKLSDSNGQSIIREEIVYIYANMSTSYSCSLSGYDFFQVTVLSGNLDISTVMVNGEAAEIL
jgi:hypothetical protein